jgi:ABC-type spermidine/putrescine transport system permease subunit II
MPRARTPAIAGWAVLAFLYVPILVLAVFSFNAGRYTSRWEGWSVSWYRVLFEGADRQARSLAAPLDVSVRLAVCAAGIAVVLATVTALGLRGARRAVALPLAALWALPVVLPDVVLGVSWRGTFEALGLDPGFATLLLAHGTLATAFGLVVVRTRLATLDPSLVEAARDLGASPFGAFRHVVLPHLRPALAAVVLLAITISFDDYMITLFLAPDTAPTLPVRVGGLVTKGASPLLNALATVSLLGTFLVALLALRLVRPTTLS